MSKYQDLPKKTLLRPEEAAEFFSVDVKTVYAWCDDGTLQSMKIKGTMRIYRQSIMKALQGGDTAPGLKSRRRKSAGC